MKRSELRRSTPLRTGSPSLRRCRIPATSKKRARENRQYKQQRRDFLEARERCEFPGGCVSRATEVHHRRGRVGADLLDVTHWSALCNPHHSWTTEHPAAAVEMGISELRIGRAS